MSDSTNVDFSKMKVIELRKELKSRGLPTDGDKSKLVARLQAVVSQEDSAEYNLDSDEIDSDGVLEDIDEVKSQPELNFDDTAANEALNADLSLIGETTTDKEKKEDPPKMPRLLKRKSTTSESKDKSGSTEPSAKKIVLKRSSITAIPSSDNNGSLPNETHIHPKITAPTETKIKISVSTENNAPSKLEMRAKRFGITPDSDPKEARKIRFGLGSKDVSLGTPSEILEKMKKRAERFGQNVSKVMVEIENKEKLAKRQEKFASSKC